MADFTYDPDTGVQKQMRPNVKKTQYGDGYTQRTQYGINQNPQIWNLTFSNRDTTETDAIESFLESKGGQTSFTWVPPNEVTERSFICSEWSVRTVNSLYKSISATFEEVFE